MAIIKCPECGNEISDNAKACPNCGCPRKKFNVPKKDEFIVKVEGIIDSVDKEKFEKKNANKVGIIIFLLIIIVVIILGISNSTKENTIITNEKVVQDNSKILNSNSSSSSEENLEDNIKFEKVAVGLDGNFIVKITNNNSEEVIIASAQVNFKDENGNFVRQETIQNGYFIIPAKSYCYSYVYAFSEDDFNKYPNCEFSFELSKYIQDVIFDGITYSSIDTGENIAITLDNQTDYEIQLPDISVVFYKNDEVVAIQSGGTLSTAKSGEKIYLNVDYPWDTRYKIIDYDKYEVSFMGADIK